MKSLVFLLRWTVGSIHDVGQPEPNVGGGGLGNCIGAKFKLVTHEDQLKREDGGWKGEIQTGRLSKPSEER